MILLHSITTNAKEVSLTLEEAIERHWPPDPDERRVYLARLVKEDTKEDGWARFLRALDFIERGRFRVSVVSQLLRKAGLEFSVAHDTDMAARCRQYADRLDLGDVALKNEILELVCMLA